MRALEFFFVLAVGAAVGAAAVLATVPEAHLADVFGSNSFVQTFTQQMNSMSHAARGIFVAFMWVMFAIVIGRVFRAAGHRARSMSNDTR